MKLGVHSATFVKEWSEDIKPYTKKCHEAGYKSVEVSLLGQNFIKFTELCTGKLTLKKLYDQYISENNPPENFWHDAIKKLKLNLIPYYSSSIIPKTGRLIVVANHAFWVADGLSICSIVSKVRYDYKIITHKVLRQADAIKDKIIPIDFSGTREAIKNNTFDVFYNKYINVI